jgi:hypothetical protein
MAGEHRVPITDDAAGSPVEVNNGVEEGSRDRGHSVRMGQRNEVCHLGEQVNDREEHRLVIDMRQALDEVRGQAGPHHAGQVQGLKEAGRLQLLHLVVLADAALMDKVLDSRADCQHEEVSSEAVESFLNALVTGPMCTGDDLWLGR